MEGNRRGLRHVVCCAKRHFRWGNGGLRVPYLWSFGALVWSVMSLWGVTPLLAVTLLGAGTGSVSPASASSTSPPVPTLPTATFDLEQIPGHDWQTTALVYDVGGNCPTGPSSENDYSLQTTSPTLALTPTSVTLAAQGTPGEQAPTSTEATQSCEVTLTFAGPQQVPATATLVLDGSSSVPLTISRNVTLFYYLAIPAMIGAAMVILLLLLSMIFVKVYDFQGEKKNPFHSKFWQHPVSASGAWTVNDSWATNIATLVAFLGSIFGITSAADSLFPGVTLDRFAILIVLAGGIVTATPLLVSVLYARWLGYNAGATADASLWLRMATLPESTAELLAGTRVTRPGQQPGPLPVSTVVRLPAGTAAVPGARTIQLAAMTSAKLAVGTEITLDPITLVNLLPLRDPPREPKTLKQLAEEAQAHTPAPAPERASAQLCAEAIVSLAEGTLVTPPTWGLVVLAPGLAPLSFPLPAGTVLRLPDDRTASLQDHAQAELPADATATIAPTTAVKLDDLPVTLPYGAESPTDSLTVLPGARATLGKDATPGVISYSVDTCISVPAGAAITVLGGATVSARVSEGRQPTHVEAGHTVQVPLGSLITILAGRIALPGGSDVIVHGASILLISDDPGIGHDPGIGNDSGALVIAGSDVTAVHDRPDDDVTLHFPVRMGLPAGAKITVTGGAEVTLPVGTRITAPQRRTFELTSQRSQFRMPQGNNTINGTMRIVILAALCTIFGVGAEIGIAAVLTVGFSDASTAGRWIAGVLSAAVGLFALYYSTTAIRALADPQPGSSMSATPGTSFTL